MEGWLSMKTKLFAVLTLAVVLVVPFAGCGGSEGGGGSKATGEDNIRATPETRSSPGGGGSTSAEAITIE